MASRLSPSDRPNTQARRCETDRRIHAVQSRMMPARFRRTTQMTLEEARWRTRELLATLRDRVHFRIRPFEWPATCDSSVASDVAARLRAGGSRCVIDPCLAKPLRDEVTTRWPD